MVGEIIESVVVETMSRVATLDNLEKIEVFGAVIERLEMEKEDCMRTEYWNENENEDRYE